jgi:hypothetical protein
MSSPLPIITKAENIARFRLFGNDLFWPLALMLWNVT